MESLPGRGPVTTSTDTLTVRPQLQCVLDPVVDKQKRTMAGEQKVLSGLFKKKKKKHDSQKEGLFMKSNVLIMKTYNHNHHYSNQMLTLSIRSLSNCKSKALLLDSSLET